MSLFQLLQPFTIVFLFSGTFTFQFNTIGTYYYWSGFVDSNNMISFRGIVNVGPSVDKTLSIGVKVSGKTGNSWIKIKNKLF